MIVKFPPSPPCPPSIVMATLRQEHEALVSPVFSDFMEDIFEMCMNTRKNNAYKYFALSRV